MSVEALDLETAWRRAMGDRPDRSFVGHPYLFEVIASDLNGWLTTLRDKLKSGFSPHDAVTCNVPKPNWMVRPGAILNLEDEVVYNAILGHFHGQLWERLKWSQGDPDIGYRLATPSKTPIWVRNDFGIWTEWRTKSLNALDEGVFFVLFTDVTGFYENIDLHRLSSDVKGVGVDVQLHMLLQILLNRWAIPRGKGIPQGYSGSDILAKLYLDPVDRGMQNAGFRHLRYVDDIRVFCKTSLEAKQALLKLNDLIRARGLNLQTGKTRIVRATEARQEIDGVTPLIQSITHQLAKELRDISPTVGGYGTLRDIQIVLDRNPEAPPPEILERAFSENFLASGDGFDKTLFHYLLTRLAKVGSRLAVEYSLRMIVLRPEETKYILRYLGDLPKDDAVENKLLDCLDSSEAVYDYQLYQIVEWFFERATRSPRLLQICRRWAFDKNRSGSLRAFCMAMLGQAADPGDLDAIEAHYANAVSEGERLEIVMSLARMEVGRRNAFMARVKGDGDLVKKAVEYVRKQGGKD